MNFAFIGNLEFVYIFTIIQSFKIAILMLRVVMKVVDRINEILKEKNISKRELANRLVDFGLKSSKTGETPSLSSLYAYLNGNIEIKADMIPYIADALGVYEQEFFSDSKQALKIMVKIYQGKVDYNKYEKIIELLEYLSPKTLAVLEELLTQNKKKIQELNEMMQRL
ncbi:helix-turn-helix transcriptional regulator [Helicobacter sp. UBA3407]|uniref:helix-turn-helix domain-containing protein n=1 Tax=Helicobacter sp. UBA3407 TaxID=1946588 RepID=UPI0026089892|nr:helix-turn-helix transcriptional regulator [Helicobacter sp. UBA3407]